MSHIEDREVSPPPPGKDLRLALFKTSVLSVRGGANFTDLLPEGQCTVGGPGVGVEPIIILSRKGKTIFPAPISIALYDNSVVC